jgi:hypothetical protein
MSAARLAPLWAHRGESGAEVLIRILPLSAVDDDDAAEVSHSGTHFA